MQQKTQNILTWVLLAALILWGGYVTFYYLGMPIHRAALMSDAENAIVDKQCTGMFCQGVMALLPFLKEFFSSLYPFLWYGIICAAAFGGWALFMWLKNASVTVRLRLRPWHFGALFLGMLWLMFTVLGQMDIDGMPMGRVIEPAKEVYRDVSDRTLQTLKENFVVLRDRNCLTRVGDAAAGVGIYDMKGICMQQAFITRVVAQLMMVSLFLFLMLIAGHTLLQFFRVRLSSILTEGMVSLGLGVGVWIAALWSFAVMGAYTANVGWSLAIAIGVLSYRSAFWWIRVFLEHEWEREVKLYDMVFLLVFLLLSYLALNFLVVVRPFPIGWDDLGSYLNRPRLLVSYGHIIPSMATFQWEYLTSLGFLLFGYHSYFGATASMIINWSEGLLAVLLVWAFARTYLGPKRGVLSALLFYSLPLIGHFSFADMKIDNAVFFMGSMAVFVTYLVLFHHNETEEPVTQTSWWNSQTRLLIVAGICISLAIGFKVTSVMVMVALFLVILGAHTHWSGAIAGVFYGLAVLSKGGGLRLDQIIEKVWAVPSPLSSTGFAALALIIGILCSAYTYHVIGRERTQRSFIYLGLFLLGVAIASAPWIMHNNIRVGRVIPALLFTYPGTLNPTFSYVPPLPTEPKTDNLRFIPPDLALDPNNPACKNSSMKEELDRYWGSGTGVGHYLLLPWRSVMNVDTGGYYVTTIPALLLFPLLLLLPYFWKPEGKWLRYLWGFTVFVIVEWMFLANGVPWYGVGMFLGLTFVLEALLAKAPNKFVQGTTGVLLALSILFAFGLRMWQFEMQQNLLEFPIGKIDGKALEERTIPYYNDIAEIALARHEALPQQPYVYRVGTFIPYFVPKNLEVLGNADHQLDFFNCIYQERNPQLTLKRMIALGFNSVIFDTNTATIERDSNGTLHQKVNAFVDFLNTPNLGTRILVNDINAGIAFVLLPPIQ